MNAEQLEIIEFFQKHAPLNSLGEAHVQLVLANLEISYFKAGSPILSFDEPANYWFVIRSGAVEVFRRDGQLYNRLCEGGYFGEFGLLRGKKVRFPAKALEDTLCYLIPATVFGTLFEQCEAFADYVEIEDNTRLKQAVSRSHQNNVLFTANIDQLISNSPLCLSGDTPVQEAAVQMAQSNQTAVIVQDESQSLIGIVTDQDFRDRVVAKGLPYSTPIRHIMTESPGTVNHNQLVFEAMMLMLRNNTQHVPVLKNSEVVGMVSQSDLVKYQSRNSLFLVNSIFNATSVVELAALKKDVQAAFVRMVQEDANSRMVGSAMAAIGRSFKQKLLELAVQELGSPPVPCCFLALGSMAREEQLIVTDQDNALIIDDRYDPALHGQYFERLANLVCDGLNACGYDHCTGKIMASNPQWRMPLAQWKSTFLDWINNPSPEGLLNSNVFFDLDGVWGETAFANELNQLIRSKGSASYRFLSSMARNAILRTPPLGFFKDFVMEMDGSQTKTINMKRRGTAPLADLIRVHALSVGSHSRNSFARLADIEKSGILVKGQVANIRDSMELISMVRIRHQAISLESGGKPDNNVDPKKLSDFERKNLKDAFQILSDAQTFLKFRYQSSRGQ
jgi:CBS domain-containing protein